MNSQKIPEFYNELRRRHVVRVAIAYVIVAWLMIEATELLTDAYNAPEWILQVFIAVAALGLPVCIVAAWAFELTSDGIVYDQGVETAPEKTVKKALVHDSSIAVLPLDYYGESDKAYLAEGITEDLTTLLSRTPGLFVIARNSSSCYRGGDISILKVGEELGVRYVTEGSVRRIGDQLRINIQLIEAATENHVWAQRFDFSEADLFKMEEDICHRVATQLVSSLEQAESDRASIMPADSQTGWLLTQRAIHVWWSGPDEETVGEAFRLIGEALEQDPEYAYALAFYGFLCIISLLMGIGTEGDHLKEKGMAAMQSAVKSAPNDPFVLFYWGVVQGFTGNMERGVITLERAKQGNPNDPHIQADLGYFLSVLGREEEGKALLKNAFLLSPHEPRSYVWHFFLACAVGKEDPEALLTGMEKSLSLFNRYIPALALKFIYLGILGRDQEASEAAKVLQDYHPNLKLVDMRRMLIMAVPDENDRAPLLEQVNRFIVD